jgi:hypothetical protein
MTFAINVTMLISAACYSPRETWRRRFIVAGQYDRFEWMVPKFHRGA